MSERIVTARLALVRDRHVLAKAFGVAATEYKEIAVRLHEAGVATWIGANPERVDRNM